VAVVRKIHRVSSTSSPRSNRLSPWPDCDLYSACAILSIKTMMFSARRVN